MTKNDLISQENHYVPRVSLEVDPKSRTIKAGQQATLRWTAKTASQLFLIQGAPGIPLMTGPTVVHWDELEQVGQRLELDGTMTVKPENTTAYVFAAIGEKGRYVTSVIVNVAAEITEPPTGHTWYQSNHLIDPDVPHLDDFVRDNEIFEAIRCSLAGTRVKLRVEPRCMFKDQEADVQWLATCSTYAEVSCDIWAVVLEADPAQRSGTSLSHFEGGGWWEPFAPRRDERTCSGEFFGLDAGCQKILWIAVHDERGRGATAEALMGFLPHPSFIGCGDVRRRDIEAALLDIYCCLLLDECLLQNRDLDHDIAAFRDGHLNRILVWQDLLAQIQNLQLMTFRCHNVGDADWRGGQWTEYTNEFELQWSPHHHPNLFYVILHELIHKIGFHGDLLGHYTEAEIENQVQRITTVIMRCCQRELPDGIGTGKR